MASFLEAFIGTRGANVSDGDGTNATHFMPPEEGTLLSDLLELGYEAGEVYLLNQPVQCIVIALIIVLSVAANSLVVHNICQNKLKMRSVNFLLIKNLCIVDLVGALLVLPVPLVVTARGKWDFGSALCTANGVINITLWLQHILMFAMLKVDRVLASFLPIGRYPLFSVEVVTGVIVGTWAFSLSAAGVVAAVFQPAYEPAVVLCIPDLPIEFFITVFSVYCLILFSMVTGYIFVMVYLKRKEARINDHNGMRVVDHKVLERAALTSFLITISHFLLYVPTMMVIGLHGWFLHPVAILFCDMIVYAEFLVHPAVLLATSTRLRAEIWRTLRKAAHAAAAMPVVKDIMWAAHAPCRACARLTSDREKKRKALAASASASAGSSCATSSRRRPSCLLLRRPEGDWVCLERQIECRRIAVALDSQREAATKAHAMSQEAAVASASAAASAGEEAAEAERSPSLLDERAEEGRSSSCLATVANETSNYASHQVAQAAPRVSRSDSRADPRTGSTTSSSMALEGDRLLGEDAEAPRGPDLYPNVQVRSNASSKCASASNNGGGGGQQNPAAQWDTERNATVVRNHDSSFGQGGTEIFI